VCVWQGYVLVTGTKVCGFVSMGVDIFGGVNLNAVLLVKLATASRNVWFHLEDSKPFMTSDIALSKMLVVCTEQCRVLLKGLYHLETCLFVVLGCTYWSSVLLLLLSLPFCLQSTENVICNLQ